MLTERQTDTTTPVEVSGVVVGGKELVVMAGPCAVEGLGQLRSIAHDIQLSGAKILRGGAFKPRTSPYTFQGLKDQGLDILAMVRKELGLPVVTEIVDAKYLEKTMECSDLLQIGSRQMQNYSLLEAVGCTQHPVLLKRGASATIKEFLLAAEYIMKKGNSRVILCERGIRTFETSTRYTLDLNAVPMLKKHTHLPVIVDPSHGTGLWWMVPRMAYAAVAAGVDGLLVEVHPDPDLALSDGHQSLIPEKFDIMMDNLSLIKQAMEKMK